MLHKFPDISGEIHAAVGRGAASEAFGFARRAEVLLSAVAPPGLIRISPRVTCGLFSATASGDEFPHVLGWQSPMPAYVWVHAVEPAAEGAGFVEADAGNGVPRHSGRGDTRSGHAAGPGVFRSPLTYRWRSALGDQ